MTRGRPTRVAPVESYRCDPCKLEIMDRRIDPVFRESLRWTDGPDMRNCLRSVYMQGFIDGIRCANTNQKDNPWKPGEASRCPER